MEQVEARPSSWSTEPKHGFLELLPLRVRPEPRFSSPNASLSEFGEHLLAGLYNHNAASEVKELHSALSTELSQLNRYAIDRAIQDLAEESALELARSLAVRLRAKFGDQTKSGDVIQAKPLNPSTVGIPRQGSPAENPLVEKSVKDIGKEGRAVIPEGKNLGGSTTQVGQTPDLVPPGGLRGNMEITANAVRTEIGASSSSQVDSAGTKSVSQLMSYDFIIFADSSGSRDSTSHRILAMKQAAQRILKVATVVNPKRSAELYFFDKPIMDSKTHTVSSAQAEDSIFSGRSTTGGQIVGSLQEKILKPLAKKIDSREVENATIVVIITNGAADTKQAPNLANVISNFKHDLNNLGTDPAVFFVFSRVGEDPAEEFFDLIERDERIQDIVCCRKENLAKRMNGKYNDQLVELLAQALETGGK